jgi:hypothetical protein
MSHGGDMKPDEILFVLENYKKIIGAVRKIIFRKNPGLEYVDIGTALNTGDGIVMFTYWYCTESDPEIQYGSAFVPISEILEELDE